MPQIYRAKFRSYRKQTPQTLKIQRFPRVEKIATKEAIDKTEDEDKGPQQERLMTLDLSAIKREQMARESLLKKAVIDRAYNH